MQSSALRVRVNLLGAVGFATYLTMAVLSFFQAPALWFQHPAAPQAASFFYAFAEKFPVIALGRLLGHAGGILISYCIPLALATVTALTLLAMLYRNGHEIDASVERLIYRWSVAFAVAACLSFPVFTQDFFLSMAWGRMLAAGINPFHNLFTPEMIDDLPLDHFPMVSSYGPVWTILSGAVMALTGKSVLAASIAFKAILLAMWIWSLRLIWAIAESRPAIERCLALVIFGWMPLGVVQILAEGHNDILMVWLMLLWLFLLLRARTSAPIALVGSALSKFATGPLFLVDAIVAWRALSWRQFILRYIAPGLVGLAIFGAFFRSMDFFDGIFTINEWRFLQPRDALIAIKEALHITAVPLEYTIDVIFVGLVAYQVVALYRQPAYETIVKASLAIMCAVMLTVIAHLWPWYLVWTLAIAAVLPGWSLSRFVIGISILGPFTLSFWWVDLFTDSREWVAVAMYVLGFAWILVTRMPAARREESPAAGSFGHP